VRTGRALGLILALALSLARPAGAAPDAAEAPRARGGEGLFEAMEATGTAATVVGRVASVERLDTHGYRASLEVESRVGSSAGRAAALPIAWEELATRRAVRFQAGDRILVVLEPLGSASLWRQRIPDADERARTAAVAAQGDAFLRDPGLASVDRLHHWLSLPPELRDAPTGVGHLVALAADAQPGLAREAARRLARVDGLDERLAPATAAQLVGALARRDLGTDFETLWTPTLERARGDALVAALDRALAAAAPNLAQPQLFEALGIAADGLPPERVALLREQPDSRYREVVARTAGTGSADVLDALLRSDPDPGVRAGALQRLVALRGAEALPSVLAALADPDPGVRAAAARGAASFGAPAVPGLRSVAYGEYAACAGSLEAPRSAIASLSLAGPSGRRTLAEIASGHPDDALRKLASIALGSLETHVH